MKQQKIDQQQILKYERQRVKQIQKELIEQKITKMQKLIKSYQTKKNALLKLNNQHDIMLRLNKIMNRNYI